MAYSVRVTIKADDKEQALKIEEDMVEAAGKLNGELIDSDVQDERDDEIV